MKFSTYAPAGSFDELRQRVLSALSNLPRAEEPGGHVTTPAGLADIWGEESTLITVPDHGIIEVRDGDRACYPMLWGGDDYLFEIMTEALDGDDTGGALTQRQAEATEALRDLGVPYAPIGSVMGFRSGDLGAGGWQHGPADGIRVFAGGVDDVDDQDGPGFPIGMAPGEAIDEVLRIAEWCLEHQDRFKAREGLIQITLDVVADLHFREGIPEGVAAHLAGQRGYALAPGQLQARFEGRSLEWARGLLESLPREEEAWHEMAVRLTWSGRPANGNGNRVSGRKAALPPVPIFWVGAERRQLRPMVQVVQPSPTLARALRSALGNPRIVEYGHERK
jgi:hypothetical protein